MGKGEINHQKAQKKNVSPVENGTRDPPSSRSDAWPVNRLSVWGKNSKESSLLNQRPVHRLSDALIVNYQVTNNVLIFFCGKYRLEISKF